MLIFFFFTTYNKTVNKPCYIYKPVFLSKFTELLSLFTYGLQQYVFAGYSCQYMLYRIISLSFSVVEQCSNKPEFSTFPSIVSLL